MKRVMLMPLVGCCFGGFFGGVGKVVAACVLLPAVTQVSEARADTDLELPLAITQVPEARAEDVEIDYDDVYLNEIEELIGKIDNLMDLNKDPTIKELRELYTSGKVSAKEHLNGWKGVLGYCNWLDYSEGSCATRNDDVFGEWFDKIMRVNECSMDQLLMYNAEKEKLNSAARNMLGIFEEKDDIIRMMDNLRSEPLDPGTERKLEREAKISETERRFFHIHFRNYNNALTDLNLVKTRFLSKFGTPCKTDL